MAIMRFNYRSQAVGGYLDITVVYPTDGLSYYDMTKQTRHHLMPGWQPRPVYRPGMKFQTIYLIHGGGDDDSLTYRYTNAERYANENNVMLVTPDIMNSFGINTRYGVEYQTFLTEELPVVIQSLFASSPRREDNFIMGYAMGGNVALGTAVRRPDLFAGCVDISGGIGMTMNTETLQQEITEPHFQLYHTSFGEAEEIEGSEYDIRAAGAASLASGAPQPKFWILSGEKEFVRDRIHADAVTMETMGYDVTYLELEGMDHNFDLWDRACRMAMEELLPLKRRPLYPEEDEYGTD